MEQITKMMLLFGTLLAILLGIIVAYFISKIITKGIKKITDAADKLAVGDMNIDVDLTSQDEIGLLAHSFAKMKDNIKTVITEITILSEKAVEGDLNIRGDLNKFNGDYKNIIEGINKTLDAVVQPVQESSNVLSEMAKGNLQISVEGNYEGDHAAMKEVINNTIMAFTDVLGDIKASAEQVAAGSKQISDSSVALSQGATEQASSVEELTASLEEISSQTKLNAENANQANGLAENAKLNAVQGNVRMKDMLKAMEDINDSSANISKIIKVIDDIAFQTNMLALNAAVEAARAGQHGKGFAVVAEEVKNLAARSANAAKETTDMIESSIKKSEEGTKIAKETAEALNKIVNEIEKVASRVNDINIASNEQAIGIEQINQGIMQVSQVIQTNSATSEESAAASEELSSQAERLKEAVNKFKLKQNSKYYGRLDGLNPEVLRMLENMSQNKKMDLNLMEDNILRESSAKTKITLSDNEFGKYWKDLRYGLLQNISKLQSCGEVLFSTSPSLLKGWCWSMFSISNKEFKQLSEYIRENYGINLKEEKITLVAGRLYNVLIQNNFKSFSEYFKYMREDRTGTATATLINRITTNHTFFMREAEHFFYFKERVLPYITSTEKDRDLRIWSAGCSSGEEPYTLAMLIDEFFGKEKAIWDSKVLATDISEKVLGIAKKGVYSNVEIDMLPASWKLNYFNKIENENFALIDRIKSEVIYRKFNLMEERFPFRRKFHVIFCKNVMIYFDVQTKCKLVNKFYDLLEYGGYLFIGHSESLNRDGTKFKYVMPAVYRKL